MEDNQIPIPEGWRKVALGKVLRYTQPYRFIVKSTNYDTKSGTPVLTAGKSFILGYTNETDNIYIETPVIIFDDFTTDTKYVDFSFKVKSSAMKFLKALDKNEIDLKYAFEKIQTIKITETGGDHKRRWISEYSKIEVLLPEFTEQQSIANILSKTDQAIANTEALIAKYTKIKTGLMQDLLTKGIDENGNIRTERTHEFKEENGFKYPKEWELTTIEKCIVNIEQGWSPNCESDPAPTNEWGILKTTAVTWNGYDANENKKMPIALTPKYHYEVKNGDVLVTRAGPNSRVGVVSYVQQTRDKIIFSDKIYRLIPQKKLLNKYLALALSSQFTQRHLSNFKTGMAESQTNISQKIVLALNILLPSPEEQKQIIETLDKAEETLKIYGIELSKLQSLKTGLMQDLLSGKVRVNNIKTKEENKTALV